MAKTIKVNNDNDVTLELTKTTVGGKKIATEVYLLIDNEWERAGVELNKKQTLRLIKELTKFYEKL